MSDPDDSGVDAKFRQTGFYDLLADGFFHLQLAKKTEDSYTINRHARASIIAFVFALECCANTLLRSLKGSNHFKDDLEKLSTVAKFDTYVGLTRNNVTIDRGRSEIQKVQELIGLRNEFVHPKVTHIPTKLKHVNRKEDHVELPFTFTPSLKQGLKIPTSAMFWGEINAFAAGNAVLEFLHYIFCDLLQVSGEDVRDMLCARIEFDDEAQNCCIEVIPDEFKFEFTTALADGFKLDFLGFVPPKKGIE